MAQIGLHDVRINIGFDIDMGNVEAAISNLGSIANAEFRAISNRLMSQLMGLHTVIRRTQVEANSVDVVKERIRLTEELTAKQLQLREVERQQSLDPLITQQRLLNKEQKQQLDYLAKMQDMRESLHAPILQRRVEHADQLAMGQDHVRQREIEEQLKHPTRMSNRMMVEMQRQEAEANLGLAKGGLVQSDTSLWNQRLEVERKVTQERKQQEEIQAKLETDPQLIKDRVQAEERIATLKHQTHTEEMRLRMDPAIARRRVQESIEDRDWAARTRGRDLQTRISDPVLQMQHLGTKLQEAAQDHAEAMQDIKESMNPAILGQAVQQGIEQGMARNDKRILEIIQQLSNPQLIQDRVRSDNNTEHMESMLRSKESELTLTDPQLWQERLDLERQITQEKFQQATLQEAIDAEPDVLRRRVEREEELTQRRHEKQLKEQQIRTEPDMVTADITRQREKRESDRALRHAQERERRVQEGVRPYREFKESIKEGKIGDALGTAKEAGTLGNMGAMLGEMIGGPVGEEIGKFIGETVQKVFEAPAKLFTGGLELMGDALKGLQGQLGPIGMGLDLMGKAAHGAVDIVNKVSPALGAMLGPLAEVPGIVQGIVGSLTSMAGVASPGTLKLFTIAVEDVQGVIGGSFLPVLDQMREGVRLFGDALAMILPNSEEVRAVLADFSDEFKEFSDEMKDVLRELGPTIRYVLLSALRALGDMVMWTAKQIGAAISWLSENFSLTRGSLRALGMDLGDRTSAGAAARNTQIQGFSQYQQQLQLAAYREPGGGPTSSDMPKLLSKVKEAAESIKELLYTFLTPQGLGKLISDAFGELFSKSPATAVAGAAKDAIDAALGGKKKSGVGERIMKNYFTPWKLLSEED